MTTHRALSSTRRLTLGVLAATGLVAALMAPAAHAQNALDNILKAKEIKIAIPVDVGSFHGRWPATRGERLACGKRDASRHGRHQHRHHQHGCRAVRRRQAVRHGS